MLQRGVLTEEYTQTSSEFVSYVHKEYGITKMCTYTQDTHRHLLNMTVMYLETIVLQRRALTHMILSDLLILTQRIWCNKDVFLHRAYTVIF